MNDTLVAPALERRCKIEEVFNPSFIELIGLAPRNTMVRGLILAQTGKMPPQECLTPEAIRHWVELNCEKRSRKDAGRRGGPGFSIPVQFSETEYGRASYSVNRSGSEEFQLTEEELVELVQEAIDDCKGIEGVVEAICDKINEEAWERCEPNLDDYGDHNYEEHDSDDVNNSNVEFSRQQVSERLVHFLEQLHPDLLEEL